MDHHHSRTVWPVTLAAGAALLGGCTSTDATSSTGHPTTVQPSVSAGAASPEGATDLMQVPEGTVLEPGTYSVRLLFDTGPTRAVVEVPEGFSGGGPVIGSDDGDIAFWGTVTRIDTDPCLGGKRIGAGTSVDDLAARLTALRHMRASQPTPVTIGGYHGVHLTLTAPADLSRCRGGTVKILTAGGPWLEWDVPRATFHEWILDVDGTRVLGGARIAPDASDRAGLIGMVESATFTGPDRP